MAESIEDVLLEMRIPGDWKLDSAAAHALAARIESALARERDSVAKRIVEMEDVVEAIDHLLCCDPCAGLEWDNANGRLGREAQEVAGLLSKVFTMAHGFNRRASCHHVHEDWRKSGRELMATLRGDNAR